MQKEFIDSASGAFFYCGNEGLLAQFNTAQPLNLFMFVWAREYPVKLRIDHVDLTLNPGQILALTPFHYVQYIDGLNPIVYQFNREFYCIKDYDREVGCVGILFYGNSAIPIVTLDKGQQIKFQFLHEIFLEELDTKDNIQAEMLRLLMARFIIKSTRLMKGQSSYSKIYDEKMDVIRMFTYLVEWNFKKEHSVAFYASQLNKSPKTISNYFLGFDKSPLQVIHDRITLEAKRLLRYTDLTAKEIAYEVGFNDASHLSRLFKKQTGESPTSFKNRVKTI